MCYTQLHVSVHSQGPIQAHSHRHAPLLMSSQRREKEVSAPCVASDRGSWGPVAAATSNFVLSTRLRDPTSTSSRKSANWSSGSPAREPSTLEIANSKESRAATDPNEDRCDKHRTPICIARQTRRRTGRGEHGGGLKINEQPVERTERCQAGLRAPRPGLQTSQPFHSAQKINGSIAPGGLTADRPRRHRRPGQQQRALGEPSCRRSSAPRPCSGTVEARSWPQ
jgi:hypothetical protein